MSSNRVLHTAAFVITAGLAFWTGTWWAGSSGTASPVAAAVGGKSLPPARNIARPDAGARNATIDASLESVSEETVGEQKMTPVERARVALDERNEFKRLQMFHRALSRLSPAEARAVQDLFIENDRIGRYYLPEYLYFTRRWGEVDGGSALAFAMKVWPAEKSYMSGNVAQMAAGWATQNPHAAVDWLNSHTDAVPWLQNAAMTGLVEGLAQRDLDQARQLVESRPDDPAVQKNLSSLADAYIYSRGLQQAETWFDALPAGIPQEARRATFSHMVSRQLRTGAQAAAAYLDRYVNEPWFDQNAGLEVAREYIRTDPDGARRWAGTLPSSVQARTVILESKP